MTRRSLVGSRAMPVLRRAGRKLAEGMRSPYATVQELADHIKHRSILAQFPVLASDHRLQPISLDVPSALPSCNPSVIDHQGGWLAVVRTHNLYTVKDGQTIDKLED